MFTQGAQKRLHMCCPQVIITFCVIFNDNASAFVCMKAAHFDERVRIGPEDVDTNERFLNLMLEFHDPNESHEASVCYALYGGQETVMPVYVAKGGRPVPGYDGYWSRVCCNYIFSGVNEPRCDQTFLGKNIF